MCDNLKAATHQALADKLMQETDALLETVAKICNNGDQDDFNWLRKFLLLLDERYCDILAAKTEQYLIPKMSPP